MRYPEHPGSTFELHSTADQLEKLLPDLVAEKRRRRCLLGSTMHQPMDFAYSSAETVKNYDGTWTEYGSLVGVPVARGDEPGEA